MACCLTAPRHYLDQCWFITSEVLCHSTEKNSQELVGLKITKPIQNCSCQWVNSWDGLGSHHCLCFTKIQGQEVMTYPEGKWCSLTDDINFVVQHSQCCDILRGLVGHFEWRQLINKGDSRWPKNLRREHCNFVVRTVPAVGISNYFHFSMWGEITYSFPNFNGTTVEVWAWTSNFIAQPTGNVITYSCWDQQV